MLFNAHLCNHILLQSGGGTWGTDLYTVRGVGSWESGCRRLTRTRLCTPRVGAPSADGPGA
jgi:hypothetical protein